MKSPLLRTIPALGLALGLLSTAAPAWAQGQTAEEKFQELRDLDEIVKKLDKDKKNRPPFEFFRSQVAPFDVLPFVKNNHWSTLTIEIRANQANYDGILQSAGEFGGRPQVPLLDMPHAIIYRREALLPKEQSLQRSLQVMLPVGRKSLILELTQPDAIRPDTIFETYLQRLEPHQMLIPILGAEPSAYNPWSALLATVPVSGDRERSILEKQRYYRLAIPQDPRRPNLSPHPLTWTTTSHLVWDNFPAEDLSRGPLSQQQAFLDWLHFGGQAIIVAAGPNVAALQEGFLGPYLPATVSGRSASLKEEDLRGLSAAYIPPKNPLEIDYPNSGSGQAALEPPRRYKDNFEPIKPTQDHPLFVAGLEPKDEPGIVSYPIGDPGNHLLAVERRVGRGRILMLAVNPNDPSLAAWPGMDTLVRRLLLRRPEEAWGGSDQFAFKLLPGPALSWVRYVARDLGAQPVPTDKDDNLVNIPGDLVPDSQPVAAWLDSACEFPRQTRSTLETASGITIPGPQFVLRVIVAYVLALVPLNWLVCRLVLRRRELAWVVVPFLALGFAYAVERAAAYDVGFDSACDEIDVVEIQGNYPRAHLSRFSSIYSTGRVSFEIAFPDDPSALALPMKSYEGLRGEEVAFSVFQSSPVPALTEFQVQPRSLAMFRAEAMVDLGGGIELVGGFEDGKIVNGTDLELEDAVLVDPDHGRQIPLGRIAAWPKTEEAKAANAHEVSLAGRPVERVLPKDSDEAEAPPAPKSPLDWADVPGYLGMLRDYRWPSPENRGELRLVAWAKEPHPGEKFTPAIDRHRGFRLVVAHLRYGMPDPASQFYYDASRPPSDLENASASADDDASLARVNPTSTDRTRTGSGIEQP